MKETAANPCRSGTFPSRETLSYHGGGGFQKDWFSEHVPLQAKYRYSNGNCPLFPLTRGKGLPSKWEDAEKWISSPASGDGASRSSLAPPPQRRPKSKSGPLGSPGIAYYASASPVMMPLFDGGRLANVIGNSPAGVLGMEALAVRGTWDIGGVGGSRAGPREPYIVRSASVHGYSDLPASFSLPDSQDDKLDGTRDVATMISPAVSRRDMATQMSPNLSSHSSPREGHADSRSESSVSSIAVEVDHNHKLEVRDVQVDGFVTMTRSHEKIWSQRHNKGLSNFATRRKKDVEACSSSWGVLDGVKGIPKLRREEAKITAWENLQKAKAEAEIRKLEMKLEKIRTSSMDKIMNKLTSAQKKAQQMRRSVSMSQGKQIARSSAKVMSVRRGGWIGSLTRFFTCHAF